MEEFNIFISWYVHIIRYIQIQTMVLDCITFLIDKYLACVYPSVCLKLFTFSSSEAMHAAWCLVTKHATIISLGVLKKCCVFLKQLFIPLPLIDRNIFNFFSRTIACELIRPARNVPLGILKEVLLFFKAIQNPTWLPWPRLVENFLFFFQNNFRWSSYDLPEMFPHTIWRNVVIF